MLVYHGYRSSPNSVLAEKKTAADPDRRRARRQVVAINRTFAVMFHTREVMLRWRYAHQEGIEHCIYSQLMFKYDYTRSLAYDICIPLLLCDESLDLSLRLLPSRCGVPAKYWCGSPGEIPECCAEETSCAGCALLAVKRGCQSFRAWTLRLGRLLRSGSDV